MASADLRGAAAGVAPGCVSVFRSGAGRGAGAVAGRVAVSVFGAGAGAFGAGAVALPSVACAGAFAGAEDGDGATEGFAAVGAATGVAAGFDAAGDAGVGAGAGFAGAGAFAAAGAGSVRGVGAFTPVDAGSDLAEGDGEAGASAGLPLAAGAGAFDSVDGAPGDRASPRWSLPDFDSPLRVDGLLAFPVAPVVPDGERRRRRPPRRPRRRRCPVPVACALSEPLPAGAGAVPVVPAGSAVAALSASVAVLAAGAGAGRGASAALSLLPEAWRELLLSWLSALLRPRVPLPRSLRADDLASPWPEARRERPEDLLPPSDRLPGRSLRLPPRREDERRLPSDERPDDPLLRASPEPRPCLPSRDAGFRVAASVSEDVSSLPPPNQPNRRDRMPPDAVAAVAVAVAATGAAAGAGSRTGAGVEGTMRLTAGSSPLPASWPILRGGGAITSVRRW